MAQSLTAKRSRSTTPVGVTAAAVEVVAVDSVVDEEVEAVDTEDAHSAVEEAAVDTMAASEVAEEVVLGFYTFLSFLYTQSPIITDGV